MMKDGKQTGSVIDRFWRILWRSIRLRCPVCGHGKLFRNWFGMYTHCPSCGIQFEREGGFFLGSIYFNYGLTALLIAIAYPILLFKRIVPENTLLLGCLVFAIVFPLLFFPLARSLWLGFDQWCDPRDV